MVLHVDFPSSFETLNANHKPHLLEGDKELMAIVKRFPCHGKSLKLHEILG